MSQAEFKQWVNFYRNYPFDDLHRYHRPAALISVSMAGGDVKERIEWLSPEPVPDGLEGSDVATMKAFGFSPTSAKE